MGGEGQEQEQEQQNNERMEMRRQPKYLSSTCKGTGTDVQTEKLSIDRTYRSNFDFNNRHHAILPTRPFACRRVKDQGQIILEINTYSPFLDINQRLIKWHLSLPTGSAMVNFFNEE